MEGKSSTYKGTVGLHKRKAEEEISSDREKTRKLAATVFKTNKAAVTTNKTTNATSANKNGACTPPKPETTPTAPKPGSLKARLAQAAAIHEAQKAKNPTGGVRHKDHREHKRKLVEEAKKAAREKQKLKGKVPTRPGQRPVTNNVKSGSLANNVKPSSVTKIAAPSPPKPTYKGTAGLGRPTFAKPIVRRTKPSSGPPLRRPSNNIQPRRRYESEDEEDEEEVEEEGEDDYDSLSDMEAGMDDIDEEEEKALQIGQLEDKKELAEDAKRKASKEARLKAIREAQRMRY